MVNLRSILPTEIGNLIDPANPILADMSAVDCAHHIHTHSHQRGQLVYASEGSLQVQSSGPIIMVPSQFAIWIPSGVEHSVTANTPIDYCSLFIDPTVECGLPAQTQLLHITTLFKELTKTSASMELCKIAGAERRLNSVILDQLRLLRPARVALPIPSDPRLQRIVSHFMANPSDQIDLSYWSDKVSMGIRTLMRHFKLETGMNIGLWLQHLKVLKAIELLEQGETVKTISYEVGYQQPSTFIEMFKRVTGQTPREYLTKS